MTVGAVETFFLNFGQNKSTLLFIYTSFFRSNILCIECDKVQAGVKPTSGVERGSAVVPMNSQKFSFVDNLGKISKNLAKLPDNPSKNDAQHL